MTITAISSTHHAPVSIDDSVAEVRDKIRQRPNRDVYCFVGAGMSVPARIPNWKELIDYMRVDVRQSHDEYKAATMQAIDSALARNDYVGAGEAYRKSGIHYLEKQRFFNSKLLDGKRPQAIHRELIRFGFKAILTTNYDHLLEDAYAQIMGATILPFLPIDLKDKHTFFNHEFSIIKLHGDAARWNTMTIGEKDYEEALWCAKAKELVNGKILLVFGVGGKDYLVNRFLFDLDDSTTVFIYMSGETRSSYESNVRAFFPSIPKHIRLRSIAHAELRDFIARLSQNRTVGNLFDCPWGEMSSLLSDSVWAEEDFDRIRSFLFSSEKCAHVVGTPGSGVSTFLAGAITDRARARDVTIFRLEAKEWMCWEIYVLHILGSHSGLLERYSGIRNQAAGPWSYEDDAKALVTSLTSVFGPVIVCIEHCDRLVDDAWRYLDAMLTCNNDDLKLILATTEAVRSQSRPRTEIRVSLPNAKRLTELSSCYAFSAGDMDRVIAVNQNCDLNTAVLAASLLSYNSTPAIEWRECVRLGKCEPLCKEIVEDVQRDEKLLQHLKACCLFRSPRSLAALGSCVESDMSDVEHFLDQLRGYGVLIAGRRSDDQMSFAMSTTIRRCLLKLLPWEENEREHLSEKIGDFYQSWAASTLKAHKRSRDAYYKAIPILSTALYHYREAGSREKYIAAVKEVAKELVGMYHFEVLRDWLDKGTALRSKSEVVDHELNCKVALMRARLALVNSVPGEFERAVDSARRELQTLQTAGVTLSKETQEVDWNDAILLTAKRQYGKALFKFQTICDGISFEGEPNYWFRTRFRIAQSLITLGRLQEAQAELNSLTDKLHVLDPDESHSSLFHHFAMLYRHCSTLATVRLLLFGFRPEDAKEEYRGTLYKLAITAADSCLNFSNRLQSAEGRMGPDQTGLGVALLKRAQAHYANDVFDKSIVDALSAASLLAAYSNNRWWRMCCHDIAARALARRRQFKKASRELAKAEAIWHDSSRHDKLRKCELLCAKGVIEYEQHRLPQAIDCFEESIAFESDSVCTLAQHLNHLATAYCRSGQHEQVAAVNERIRHLSITW